MGERVDMGLELMYSNKRL